MTEPVLSVTDLTIALPGGADRRHAIEAIGFDVAPNEILCIVGESGSGKSMTARAIMGLLLAPHVRVVRGRIMFGGIDLATQPEAAMRRLRGAAVAMVFQEPMTSLNPLMRVGDQLAEVLRAHTDLKPTAIQARVQTMLAAVNLPEPESIGRVYPFRLSGGQRQRVMIAMALALEPRLLIADEPTTALDVTTQMQILKLIKRIQAERGMGVMFITHDFGVVAEIADRVAVMQDGRIVEIGSADAVLNCPQHPYTQRLIAAVPNLSARAPSPPTAQPVVLEVRRLAKTYRTRGGLFSRHRIVHAVRDVDLTIRAGETIALVGESGCGKTTVSRCLVRLIEPDRGSVRCQDVDMAGLGARALRPFRKRIQMVFQDPFASLNPRKRVGRIIAEGPMAHGMKAADAVARAAELLALVGLEKSAADRFPHEFSGGQRQRIGIARALALDPAVLIADEPVSALDVSIQAQVLELLADIRRRLNLAMLFITHDLRVAAQIADVICVMKDGEIVERNTPEAIFGAAQHPYTRELIDSIPGRAWLAIGAAGTRRGGMTCSGAGGSPGA